MSVSPPPYRAPMVDVRTGLPSAEWIRHMEVLRVGRQTSDDHAAELMNAIAAQAAAIAALAARVGAAEASTAALSARLEQVADDVDALLVAPEIGGEALALLSELSKRVQGLEQAPEM